MTDRAPTISFISASHVGLRLGAEGLSLEIDSVTRSEFKSCDLLLWWAMAGRQEKVRA